MFIVFILDFMPKFPAEPLIFLIPFQFFHLDSFTPLLSLLGPLHFYIPGLVFFQCPFEEFCNLRACLKSLKTPFAGYFPTMLRCDFLK